MEWRDLGWQEFRYVDPLGRIVGGCEKRVHSWDAWCDGKSLGEYISAEHAKAAVEARFLHNLNPMAG